MNMQRKNGAGYGAVIAAICIIIYLFALVQASVRLYLSIDNCRIKAEQEFSRIAGIALSAGMQGFMDDRFIETMNSALASSEVIEALIITGPDREIAIERQPGRAITWVNNTPRFVNRFSFSNQSHYRPLPIHDLRNANIKAVAGAFDYNEISKILKETLLLILIGFAIAFFTMLLQLLTGKPERVYSHEETGESHVKKPEHVSPPVKHTEPVHRKMPEKQDVLPPEPEKQAEAVPKGLYSPRSNIGWEEYINDRLDSELHRCSSTENDLTLILMEFTDITNDDMYMQAAEEAVSFFSSRDLLFENGKYGIVGILPGIDLDTGISKAEKFYQRVMEKFPNGHDSSSSLCIGLTSRSGRLLNASRLMFEGKEALQRAQNDPRSSIIAFKSDPEKYREFIRTHS
jgi:hypothetical protein